MPFSSLNDPADVARAHAALDRTWEEIKTRGPEHADLTAQRERLAYIVASSVLAASDEHDLVQRAVARFRKTK